MATFTSGISWETDEWFRTFSESFPQYTQPGIWIAAEERFASLRGAKLEWEATTRTVRLKLKNSRGAQQQERVLFGGRLAQYTYADMDDTVAAALRLWERSEEHTSELQSR